MKKLGLAFVLSALSISTFAAVGCGSEFDSCESNESCGNGTGGTDGGTGATGGTSGTGGTGNTGGTSGTGATGGDGGGCDTTKSPSEDTCVVDDQYAVFVSPTGNDSTGDGSKGKPFKTLGKGVGTAATAGKVVLACDDGSGLTETGTVSVTNALDGLGMYGGFDCSNWAWSSTAKATVNGAAVALTIDGIATGFTVESFDIKAANATNPGESSFGAIVTSSKGIVLKAVNLTAGDGNAGDAGSNGTQGPDGDDPTTAQNGKAATCTSAPGSQDGGKWNAPSTCGSFGGDGGKALLGATGQKGSAGIPQANVTPPNIDNGGAAGTGTGNGVQGSAGSNGNAGTLGSAAASAGSFASTGFTPADGGPGTDGFPGQGGGGGGASAASSSCIGASGGAGGMGGCGGGKGGAGKGGGASVALFSWQSTVSLTSCTLTAGKGGDGGAGGDAAAGGSGKSGGNGGAAGGGFGKGGSGGDGGTGGPGGSGSGGTGGPSYAMVWNGTKPTATQSTLKEGSGGALGVGGKLQGSSINPAPDGTPGDAAKEFEQK